jgi:hypothetical protein
MMSMNNLGRAWNKTLELAELFRSKPLGVA